MSTVAVKIPSVPQVRGWRFGLGWSMATQVVGTFLKLASTLVLTRLLAPEAYALVGTAMVVLTTLEWLCDFGITPALLRDPCGEEPTRLLVGWWMNLGRGTVLSLAAVAAAMPLAALYDQPELAPVLMILAIRPIFMALRSPGVVLLRRHLQFRSLFVDEIAQVAIGTVVSITVAMLLVSPNGGVWALVAGTMAGAIAGVVCSYWLAPMRPRWAWDREAGRALSRFGWPILANTLVMAAWLNLDRLLGPKVLPLAVIGVYLVAWNLAAAAEAVVTRGTDVYYTLLSRQHAEARSAWHVRTAGKLSWCVGPVLALGVAVAPAAVRVLYDPRYHAAALVLAVLLARLVIRTAGQMDFQLLLASGQIRSATIGYIAGAIVQGMLTFPLAGAYGAVGLAVSVLISTTVVAAVPVLLPSEARPGGRGRLLVAIGWASVGLLAGYLLEQRFTL